MGIGFYIKVIDGTPPDYRVGIWNLGSDGRPDEASLYGGSALEEFTPGGIGWQWVTLSTPATAVKGDFIGIGIVAGTTPPDGTDNITVDRFWGR